VCDAASHRVGRATDAWLLQGHSPSGMQLRRRQAQPWPHRLSGSPPQPQVCLRAGRCVAVNMALRRETDAGVTTPGTMPGPRCC